MQKHLKLISGSDLRGVAGGIGGGGAIPPGRRLISLPPSCAKNAARKS